MLSIDTEWSLRAVGTWSGWADDLLRAGAEVALHDPGLQLAGVRTASARVGSAAVELAGVALFVQLVVDRVVAADQLGLAPDLSADGVAQLAGLARSVVRTPESACSAFRYELPPAVADFGGTGDGEAREPYVLGDASSVERGRSLVMRALRDTASSEQIRTDEFQVVRMSDGRYLVVLPGVTDLSRPQFGLDPTHRSVRDVDQFAYPSSRSTGIDDNGYARMVVESLTQRGVPVGSELVIVGHSYGADTALDLASDDGFNGAGGFRVTHVVAAAYHSGPQLPHVPSTTEVLVLQNRRDLPVIAEAVGEAHVVESIEARRSALDDVLSLDPLGAVRHMADAVRHDVGIAVETLDHVIDRRGDVARVVVGTTTHQPWLVVDGAADFVTLEPGISTPRPGQVVVVFDGGGAGAGHHQDNYLDELAAIDDEHVAGFLASLGADTAPTGSAWAIDVSVP